MSKPAPVQASERIDILDTTRGIAVLGILLMNITGFGLPFAYEDPTNWGGHAGKNLFVWRVMSLFFEGTMRGLFTLLFGAGVILFLERHRQRDPNASVATLYYRRTVLLIVFGLINGYVLLWDGDILFYYGAIGLFLYFFRNLSIRSLIAAAAIVFAIQVGIGVYEYLDYARVRDVAHDAQYDYRTSSIETEMAINEYEAYQQDFKPSYSQVERTIEVVRESYASAFRYISQRTFFVQTSYFFRHGLGDVLSFMLLGMALLKAGILTGAASRRTYAWFALAGYTLGLTINAFETVSFERADFSVDALMQTYLTYDLGRLPMTLGHVGAIMLMVSLPRLRQSTTRARRRRPHGADELSIAQRDLPVRFHGRRACALRTARALSALFRRARHLDCTVDLEPAMAQAFPLWTRGMVVAHAYIRS